MKRHVKGLLEKASHLLPDKLYILMRYRMRMGEWPDLKNPKTYNEKLQWIKLYDRKPEYITMVDKYAVKEYVAKLIGEEYIIPNLGVWDKVEDIDFEKLPQQFVLKCTHDSGGLVICKDKSKLDIEAAKKKINGSLNSNINANVNGEISRNIGNYVARAINSRPIQVDINATTDQGTILETAVNGINQKTKQTGVCPIIIPM